ncbi:o-succinylbenzoate synthase [Nesterenkonia lutea]|uniref:o-succinylbenzoate synthase n=1 Tax=Nesterenkonia lutea TaxID=272919 RepID=A0ABR9JB05_9MICC|nr:o-succinylbenzoate synthase [Nesterenkonia lutea]MBE1522988.1 O-succinylbenzoate synthase [Nesterenkonia lutea]
MEAHIAVQEQGPDAWQIPDLEEVLDGARVVSLLLRTRFRGQTERQALLMEGPKGWGEFSPFPEYGAQESSHWLRAGLEAGWRGWGAPLRTHVPINATMPAVAPDQVESVLRRFGALESIPAVKIKVAEPGQTLADDLARFREVRRLVPEAGLRADANGGWSIAEAVPALAALAEAAEGRFEYAEQPVAGVEPLAELREALAAAGVITSAGAPLRIAADEAVRKAEDPLRVARLGAADLIVVKVPPLGGVDRALRIVEQSGLDAVVSSALDTSVGLAAGLALAARLPHLPYACGLGTAALFTEDVLRSPLIPVGGALRVPGAVVPSADLLQRHEVGGPRADWWFDRLRAAHAVLAADQQARERASADAGSGAGPDADLTAGADRRPGRSF